MPENCPNDRLSREYKCTECPNCRDRKCYYDNPAVELSEILTPEERIDMLEEELDQVKLMAPSYVLADIRKDLNSLTGEFRHFENIFNEHTAPLKKKRIKEKGPKKDKSEGVEIAE